jgi:hypothetical protein
MPGLGIHTLSVVKEERNSAPAAEQAARRGTAALAVLEGDFAVHQHRAIALGALHASPFTAGEIVDDFKRFDGELVEVIDDDVGAISFDQSTAILEAPCYGRMCTQTEMQFLEREHIAVAAHPDQCLGRVAATREEFGVGAAVRHAEYRHAVRGDHLLQVIVTSIEWRRIELGIESVRRGGARRHRAAAWIRSTEIRPGN